MSLIRPLSVCFVNPLGHGLFFPQKADESAAISGGAEVQLYYLALELARDSRFQVTTLVERRVGPDLERALDVEVRRADPIGPTLARLRRYLPLPAGTYWRALRKVDADLYVQRGGALLTGEVGVFCRAYQRRFVFMTAHQWDCDRTHQRGPSGLCGRFYNVGLRAADLVYTQSGDHSNLLRRHYGINGTVFPIVYPDPEQDDTIHSAARTVLWAGRVLSWKRPLLFVQLADAFPGVPFVMACRRHPEAHELFELTRTEASKRENITFHHNVPFAAMTKLFRAAQVHVNTSRAEGFPNTFVQASRCGVPVVSLAVDPDGLLGSGRFGFCCGDNWRECVRRVGQLLHDHRLRTEYADKARRYFHDHHRLASNIEAFKAALWSLV